MSSCTCVCVSHSAIPCVCVLVCVPHDVRAAHAPPPTSNKAILTLCVYVYACVSFAVPFLVCMMQTRNEDECLHAARLTAILAQSPPTHEPLRTHNTTAALLPLVDSPNPLVVEHACSVFAIMANNPDTHFHVSNLTHTHTHTHTHNMRAC